jgi:hypothetical protein
MSGPVARLARAALCKKGRGNVSCPSSFLREFVEDISLEPVEPFLPEMRIPLTTLTALGYKTLHT